MAFRNNIGYPGLATLDVNNEIPNVLKSTPQISTFQFPTPFLKLPDYNPYKPGSQEWMNLVKQQLDQNQQQWDQTKQYISEQTKNHIQSTQQNKKSNQILAQGIGLGTDYLSNLASDKLFGDSDLERGFGALFSSGLSSAGNTMANNLFKGQMLTEGLGQNVGASLSGTARGLTGQYIGQGISSLGGHSRLSNAIGAGVASGIGQSKSIYDSIKTLKQANSILKAGEATKDATDLAKAAQMASKASLWGAGMSVTGSALGAAAGPSKEYGGKYGNVTRTMDTIYDVASAAVNFVPGFGQLISGAMVLNKGLSNVFGSTDGMTVQDAILGSAFMPAPVKWANVWGSSTTGTFGNQSWQNSMKANSFMGNAFGNLNDRFDQAREEAGKTYGTFSQGAKRRAQDNLDFANQAWNKILAMSDQNELQNIRSQYMSSINNQRYAQEIGGPWQPVYRGRYGMKIFNNATNHNIGMRLLSGAALIDNKQMILCSAVD